MENTTPNSNTETSHPVVVESILYVHGRRIIIFLVIILLLIGILGVLYYNGKVVYENGL